MTLEELAERLAALEHAAALDFYHRMPTGSERGKVRALLHDGKKLRLVANDDALGIEAQVNNAKYKEWAPADPLVTDNLLPQLRLLAVHYKKGFDKEPYYDGGSCEERVRYVPNGNDELWIKVKREDSGHVEELTLYGKSAGAFMNLIKPMEKKASTEGAVIDALRAEGKDEEADKLQFGEEGKDEYDGHRCRVCGRLAGGDRRHRCWA
jgi:hypothetical protein